MKFDKLQSNPRYFEVPREMEKKFEMAGFQNNQGKRKGDGLIQGKSIFLRNSGDFELTEFEIAGFDCSKFSFHLEGKVITRSGFTVRVWSTWTDWLDRNNS